MQRLHKWHNNSICTCIIISYTFYKVQFPVKHGLLVVLSINCMDVQIGIQATTQLELELYRAHTLCALGICTAYIVANITDPRTCNVCLRYTISTRQPYCVHVQKVHGLQYA